MPCRLVLLAWFLACRGRDRKNSPDGVTASSNFATENQSALCSFLHWRWVIEWNEKVRRCGYGVPRWERDSDGCPAFHHTWCDVVSLFRTFLDHDMHSTPPLTHSHSYSLTYSICRRDRCIFLSLSRLHPTWLTRIHDGRYTHSRSLAFLTLLDAKVGFLPETLH